MKEDEIEVLGMAPRKERSVRRKGRKMYIIIFVASIVITFFVGVLCWLWVFLNKDSREDQLFWERAKEDWDKKESLLVPNGELTYHFHSDDVNDVPMHFYHLDNMEASLAIDSTIFEDTLRTRMMLVVLATDIREDNK